MTIVTVVVIVIVQFRMARPRFATKFTKFGSVTTT